MNKEQAETFRKRWKTPPRAMGSPAYLKSPVDSPTAAYLKSPVEQNPITGSPLSSYPNVVIRQRCTPNKMMPNDSPLLSIERTSRRLFESNTNEDDANSVAAKKILFKNYRDRTPHDDSMNESQLNASTAHNFNDNSFNDNQPNWGFLEREIKLADVNKGLEVIGRGLAKSQRVPWTEYWSFLNEFLDISTPDGLTKFEKYLQLRLDERMKPPPISIAQRKLQLPLPVTPISKMSQRLTNLHIEKDQPDPMNTVGRTSTPSSPNAFNAYMCVEKSCQIYANRVLKPIAQNPANIVTVNDVLVGELNRLKSLICSYKQDIHFFAVDFEATHSRFAHIIVALLNSDREYKEHNVGETLKTTITHILQAKEKSALNASKNGQNDHSKGTIQLICLIKYLLKRLKDQTNLIPPEILTTETDCAEIWRGEDKCECEWINANGNSKVNRHIQRKSQRWGEDFGDFCDKLIMKGESEDDQDDDIFWVNIFLHFDDKNKLHYCDDN